ncbi:peptidoglycan-binding protein [Sphaerisporangium melleum]|uniref:peptidoglycan-binding protein n=1 Tax=Sphaerisporangium melleum TaxID=321316 RepID=UPI0035EC1121
MTTDGRDGIGGSGRRRRTRRIVAGGTVLAVVLGGAVAAGYAVTATPEENVATATVPTATGTVARGRVAQSIRLAGAYGFDGSYSIVHQGAPGILTAAARPAARVGRGGVLFRVDGRAVRLLYGTIPAYRDLRLGMTDGRDVRQLERNLVALGMDPGRLMTVDDHFTAATAAAVRRLQKAWGVPASGRTGQLPLGSVVFLPGRIRVSAAQVSTGAGVRPGGPVLSATSTRRVVTADLPADRQNAVAKGDRVTVTLPGAVPARGKVLRVGRVATAPKRNEGPSGPATVELVMTVRVPRGAPELDKAPVQVMVATAVRQNVLTVPVAALLARPGGGYQVRLASGAYVQVKPGLFDETTGRVEVTGGVRDGDRVEVPES